MGPSRTSRRLPMGYTLIELMMIVIIIAISVVSFAPGFGRAMADRRVTTATRELIRIGRRARSDTFGYLRAHLIWVQPAAGTIQLLRGPTNSCQITTWPAIQGDCALNGPRCLENFQIARWAPGEDIALREELLAGGAVNYSTVNRALCFAPSGVVFSSANNAIATASTSLSAANGGGGGFVYTLHSGTENPVIGTDRIHRVLFPLGSTPRALR